MLIVKSRLDFGQLLALLILDLLVAFKLKFMDFPLLLLIPGLLLLTSVRIINFGVTEKVVAVPLFFSCSDLTVFIVVEDVDKLLVKVELCLPHLLSSWLFLIQFKLLSHLLDADALYNLIVVLLQNQVLVLNTSVVWVEAATSVSQLVWSVLVLFNDLVFGLADEFLSQDQTVLVPMMVVVKLLVLAIDLN